MIEEKYIYLVVAVMGILLLLLLSGKVFVKVSGIINGI